MARSLFVAERIASSQLILYDDIYPISHGMLSTSLSSDESENCLSHVSLTEMVAFGRRAW